MSTLKFSSLHGGLIARKGQASPAVPSPMRHVTYTDAPPPADAPPPDMIPYTGDQRRDIEMHPDLPLIATKEVITLNTRNLTEELQAAFPQSRTSSPASKSKSPCLCPSKAATARKARYRVTVRITAEQRRRMRVSAAQLEKTNQQIVSKALDAYLDALGINELKKCTCLERQAGLN